MAADHLSEEWFTPLDSTRRVCPWATIWARLQRTGYLASFPLPTSSIPSSAFKLRARKIRPPNDRAPPAWYGAGGASPVVTTTANGRRATGPRARPMRVHLAKGGLSWCSVKLRRGARSFLCC
jgi:hypothetical protein